MIDENINQTGISFFAIFDGHGGEFAAVFAKDHLVPSLYSKLTESSNILKGRVPSSPVISRGRLGSIVDDGDIAGATTAAAVDAKAKADEKPTTPNTAARRRASFKKSYSTADDCNGSKTNCNREQDVFMDKINSLVRTKDTLLKNNNNNAPPPKTHAAQYYIENGSINFGKMICDEVLATDYKLIETAKKAVSLLIQIQRFILGLCKIESANQRILGDTRK